MATTPADSAVFVDDEGQQSLGQIAQHVSMATNQKTGIPDIQPVIEQEVLKPPAIEQVPEKVSFWAKFFPWARKTTHTTPASNFLNQKMELVEDKSGGE